MRVCIALLLVSLLGACVTRDLRTFGNKDPLLFKPSEVEQAGTLAIFVPGALSPVEIFDNAEAWENDGYAIVHYRLPGLDGLQLDHRLDIQESAGRIVEFAQLYPEKKIRLIGYSTGAAVVLTAASQLHSRDVRVAAISSVVPYPASICVGLRGLMGVVRSATRTVSLDRETIWLDQYKTLLFGAEGRTDPTRADSIRRIFSDQKDKIVVPKDSMLDAHSGDLTFWQPDTHFYQSDAEVRFFHGSSDPVIPIKAITDFTERFQNASIRIYPGHGHILFYSTDTLFDDMRSFFDGPGNIKDAESG